MEETIETVTGEFLGRKDPVEKAKRAQVKKNPSAPVKTSGTGRVALDAGTAHADFSVGGSADAHYDAGYTGSTTIGDHEVGIDATVGVDVHGEAGAYGSADVTVNDNGAKVDVGGEAFAGAQAGIEGTASIGVDGTQLGSVSGGAEGWV